MILVFLALLLLLGRRPRGPARASFRRALGWRRCRRLVPLITAFLSGRIGRPFRRGCRRAFDWCGRGGRSFHVFPFRRQRSNARWGLNRHGRTFGNDVLLPRRRRQPGGRRSCFGRVARVNARLLAACRFRSAAGFRHDGCRGAVVRGEGYERLPALVRAVGLTSFQGSIWALGSPRHADPGAQDVRWRRHPCAGP